MNRLSHVPDPPSSGNPTRDVWRARREFSAIGLLCRSPPPQPPHPPPPPPPPIMWKIMPSCWWLPHHGLYRLISRGDGISPRELARVTFKAPHTRTVPSLLADTIRVPSGLNATERISDSWPMSTSTSCPVPASHRRMVRSLPAVTSLVGHGTKAPRRGGAEVLVVAGLVVVTVGSRVIRNAPRHATRNHTVYPVRPRRRTSRGRCGNRPRSLCGQCCRVGSCVPARFPRASSLALRSSNALLPSVYPRGWCPPEFRTVGHAFRPLSGRNGLPVKSVELSPSARDGPVGVRTTSRREWLRTNEGVARHQARLHVPQRVGFGGFVSQRPSLDCTSSTPVAVLLSAHQRSTEYRILSFFVKARTHWKELANLDERHSTATGVGSLARGAHHPLTMNCLIWPRSRRVSRTTFE
jgi:hypothetical protein